MKFSANLGFLWTDRSLPEAIRAAGAAGFDAVECHFPYETPAADLRAVLDETGLAMLGINTARGQGQNGLCALPGREVEARIAIDQAVAYAAELGVPNVHVMAGTASGAAAHQTFLANLHHACNRAARHGITVLIEPLNRHDAPGYFLKTTDQARDLIAQARVTNLKLMFDCYHVGRTEGDLITRLKDLRDIIGHIQFASVPDRGPPDHGEIDYSEVFSAIAASGWSAPLGAEYKPAGDTDASLEWLRRMR